MPVLDCIRGQSRAPDDGSCQASRIYVMFAYELSVQVAC